MQGMKQCSKCKEIKQNKEFYIDNRAGRNLYTACKACWLQHEKNKRHALKRKAFDILGNKCVRCGFDDMRALQIDHINGGGGRRKRLFGEITMTNYRKIVAGDSRTFQLLWANCNYIKRVENGEEWGPR